jgi:hypothetical protein
VTLLLGGLAETAQADDVSESPTASLPCGASVDDNTLAGVQRVSQMSVVLDVVALPTRAAFPASQGVVSSLAFYKQALFVRTHRSFRLSVAPAWRNRASISYGDSERTSELVVTDCEPRSSPSPFKWLTFIGGFYTTSPGCVPVAVTAGHRTKVVHLGLGAACPGQKPLGVQ